MTTINVWLFAIAVTRLTVVPRLIESANKVVYFKTDRPDYFEIRVSDHWDVVEARDNEFERIYYWAPFYAFPHIDLDDDLYESGIIVGKILLVGYVGDYITEEVYDFQSARITPMNKYRDEYQSPDMYDIQISGIIVANIIDETFIDEVNPLARVFILLAFCLVNAAMIIYVQTRWLIVNLFICLSAVVVLALGSFLVLLSFQYNLYLHLNELTVLLIISSLSTIILSYRERSDAN